MAVIYSALRQPLIEGDKTLAEVTEDACRPITSRPTALWWLALVVAFATLLIGLTAIAYEVATGVGTWGLNRTVGWAFDITNFVFWIGIGHAGTLISAILFCSTSGGGPPSTVRPKP